MQLTRHSAFIRRWLAKVVCVLRWLQWNPCNRITMSCVSVLEGPGFPALTCNKSCTRLCDPSGWFPRTHTSIETLDIDLVERLDGRRRRCIKLVDKCLQENRIQLGILVLLVPELESIPLGTHFCTSTWIVAFAYPSFASRPPHDPPQSPTSLPVSSLPLTSMPL